MVSTGLQGEERRDERMNYFVCDKCQQPIGTSVYTITVSTPHNQGEYEYHLCQACHVAFENWLDERVIHSYQTVEYLEAIPASAHRG
jgi:hypothetical protein